MRTFRSMLFLSLVAVFCVATSRADSAIGYFDLDSSLSTVPAVGQVTLTLNGDGTISADVEDYGSSDIFGFGYNSSAVDISESDFAPTAPDNADGWIDAFGYQASGFECSACGLDESFVIDGNYTSVYDVLDGGSQSSVDFFLYDDDGGQWGADAQPNSVTPEPGTLLLLGTGALALLGATRRKHCRGV